MENSISTELRDILYSHNLRNTPERRMILEQIYKEDNVFSASDIWNYLDERNIYISLATVYNTLILFENLGIIFKVPTMGSGNIYILQNDRKQHKLLKYPPVSIKKNVTKKY